MSSKYFYYIWRGFTQLLGIFLFSCGIYLYLNWIDIFTKLRGQEMALSANSTTFYNWKSSPLPLYFDVYLFNWTNSHNFYVNSTEKPHFEQCGPYRFRDIQDKVDIEWHNHNNTVSFRKKSIFYFDKNASHGNLDDKIITLNTVAHSAALRVKNGNIFQKKILERTLKLYNEDITVTKSANELMFTGYFDPLVTMGNFISIFTKDIKVPYNKVGLLYSRNDSAVYDGHFNMYTGSDDLKKLGQVHTWNYMTNNGVYPRDCGEVKGSLGEFFEPNLTPKGDILMYFPNMCRTVPLEYSETTKVYDVTAYKFIGGAKSIDNGTNFPEAKCFCVDKCELSGVINLSPCKFNSSIYMSYPHFYKADPTYLDAVDGLKPNKEKHEFFMTLEPNTGLVMDVGGGFQANYLIEPISQISLFENIPRTFIPLMWCEERVKVTSEIAKNISIVAKFILLGQIVTAILLAGGFIILCWYPTRYLSKLCQNDDPKSKTLLSYFTNTNNNQIGLDNKTSAEYRSLIDVKFDNDKSSYMSEDGKELKC